MASSARCCGASRGPRGGSWSTPAAASDGADAHPRGGLTASGASTSGLQALRHRPLRVTIAPVGRSDRRAVAGRTRMTTSRIVAADTPATIVMKGDTLLGCVPPRSSSVMFSWTSAPIASSRWPIRGLTLGSRCDGSRPGELASRMLPSGLRAVIVFRPRPGSGRDRGPTVGTRNCSTIFRTGSTPGPRRSSTVGTSETCAGRDPLALETEEQDRGGVLAGRRTRCRQQQDNLSGSCRVRRRCRAGRGSGRARSTRGVRGRRCRGR